MPRYQADGCLAEDTTALVSGHFQTVVQVVVEIVCGQWGDLRLIVNSFSVNEASSHAVFTVQVVGGQFLELALANGTASGEVGNDPAVDGSEDFGPGLQCWSGSAWVDYTSRLTVPGTGPATLLVRTALINDPVFEGTETLRLTATYFTENSGGSVLRSATGQATIRDEGTGVRFEFNNNEGSLKGTTAVGLNDDRTLFVSSPVVNEASGWMVYRVTGTAGSTLDLELAAGSAPAATIGTDTSGPLEVYNGTDWVPYNPTTGAVFPANSSLMLVRVAIVNDGAFEGRETLALQATLRGTDTRATGTAFIVDDGTGAIFRSNGTEDLTAPRDDDRLLKVNSVLVNEGSTYAVFTINAEAGDALTLSLLDTNNDPAVSTANLGTSPPLLFWNVQTNAWTPVSGSVTMPTGGALHVRVNITAEQEREYEGRETFRLQVDSSRLNATTFGTATINDDGTGVRFTGEIRDNTPVSNTQDLDDDLDKDGINPTTEDQLATLVTSQGIGSAKAGDLNGDGVPDAEQNALATLAWLDVASFTAGNEGTLTDVRPIISLMVLEGTTDNTVSRNLQLENIRVVGFDDAQFGSARDAVSVNTTTGVRTVTLAGGSTVDTAWDPIRFELGTQADGEALTDLFPDRSGVQVRLYIDLRASGLDEAEFNRYIKFVSAEAAAAGKLVDLDGKDITAEGWYDFTQRTPGGDGARFVIEAGKVVGIELTLTDNGFGDNDLSANRILDPGVLARSLVVDAPTIVPPQPDEQPLVPVAQPEATEVPVLSRENHEPLRFDSALHPLWVAESLSSSYLTEPVDSSRFPIENWMRYFDLYTTQDNWRVAVMPADGDQLAVFRGMGDWFAQAEASGEIVVPWDAFAHSQTSALVALEATLADGSALPGWLQFDPRTGRFSYRLPADWRGELVIRLVARDGKGNEASTLFRLQGGERAKASAEQPANTGLHEQLRDAARQRQTDWGRAENAALTGQAAPVKSEPAPAHG